MITTTSPESENDVSLKSPSDAPTLADQQSCPLKPSPLILRPAAPTSAAAASCWPQPCRFLSFFLSFFRYLLFGSFYR